MHYAGRVSIDALFSFDSFGIILPNPLGHGVFRCDANSKFFAMFLSFRFSPLSIDMVVYSLLNLQITSLTIRRSRTGRYIEPCPRVDVSNYEPADRQVQGSRLNIESRFNALNNFE